MLPVKSVALRLGRELRMTEATTTGALIASVTKAARIQVQGGRTVSYSFFLLHTEVFSRVPRIFSVLTYTHTSLFGERLSVSLFFFFAVNSSLPSSLKDRECACAEFLRADDTHKATMFERVVYTRCESASTATRRHEIRGKIRTATIGLI